MDASTVECTQSLINNVIEEEVNDSIVEPLSSVAFIEQKSQETEFPVIVEDSNDINYEENTATTSIIPQADSISRIDHISIISDLEKTNQLKLKKSLKILHVYSRYKQKTNCELPPNLDFFGKSILGLTSILKFEDSLESSFRILDTYLDVSL